LGGTATVRVNIRIIAATNQDLADLVRAGKFRQDLYYRMNIFPISLPPLRNRQGDICVLAEYFLSLFGRSYERLNLKLSDEIIEIFKSHTWPGNVRQLKHVIEYALLKCKEEKIALKHLPGDFLEVDHNMQSFKKKITIDEHIKSLIIQTLNKYNGNRNKTCKELNISRTTLWRWINKYKIFDS
jgi:transcriptional regulator with PAS, ATPase and Fis domain